MRKHKKEKKISGVYNLKLENNTEETPVDLFYDKPVIIIEYSGHITVYYHAIFDFLNYIYNILKNFNGECYLIYPNANKHVIKYIDYYKLPIILLDFEKPYNIKNFNIHSETIYFIDNIYNCGHHWSSDFFNFLIRNKPKNSYENKKIYINRKPLHSRNFSENLCLFFEDNGYEKHIIDDYSIDEQVKLFNSASHIIAAHGSALTNIIFCNEYTKVIEINPAYNAHCYINIAKNVDNLLNKYIDYYCLYPESFYENFECENYLITNSYELHNKILAKDENENYWNVISNNTKDRINKENKKIKDMDFSLERLLKII
jgi:hypothetical protein